MSNARYLEIDSTYRNRTDYPLAANFVLPISMSGRKGSLDAVDPVSLSAIETVWTSNQFQTGTTIAPVLPTAPSLAWLADVLPLSSTTGAVILIIEASAGSMQRTENYYVAAVLRATATPTLACRIVASKFMGTGYNAVPLAIDRMKLVLQSKFEVAIGSAITISDPTDLSSTVDPWFFIPNGMIAPNAYPNTVLHNQILNEYRPITLYQSFTHLTSLDTSGSATSTTSSGPVTNWLPTHTYSIRPQPPCVFDDIAAGSYLLTLEGLDPVPSVTPNHSSFNLNPALIPIGKNYTGDFLEIETSSLSGVLGAVASVTTMIIPLGETKDDYYVGCTITITSGTAAPAGVTKNIVGYIGASRTITISPGFSAVPAAGDDYIIRCPQKARRIVRYADYRGTAVQLTTTFIDFPVDASDFNRFYVGFYIRLGPAATILRLITNYTVTKDSSGAVLSRRATFSSPIVVPVPPTFSITSGVVSPSFLSSIAPGPPGPPFTAPTAGSNQAANILAFGYDNLNPFVYTGSLTSQEEMVCYEIELLNLVLPNTELAVASGGNIAFYPYVYVELQNVSASGARLKNIIYSNNPNATNMLFRAAIDDVPNPLNSSFIKIDGDGAVQTIKFKPNDNLKFSVRMQTGEIFQTILPEFFSPNQPNPLAQISAYFSIKRV